MDIDKKDSTCFPFNSTDDIVPESDMELNEEEEEEQVNNEVNEIFNIKFITKKYYQNEKGKKRREKKVRKYKPDNIRKKIKEYYFL
jgi:hypothetical protein